jgi:hypothetical protein
MNATFYDSIRILKLKDDLNYSVTYFK